MIDLQTKQQIDEMARLLNSLVDRVLALEEEVNTLKYTKAEPTKGVFTGDNPGGGLMSNYICEDDTTEPEDTNED